MCKIQIRVAPEAQLEKHVFFLCQKPVAWSIGGSKADLLELKVAAWALVRSGLES
jgi:hypothetical protein